MTNVDRQSKAPLVSILRHTPVYSWFKKFAWSVSFACSINVSVHLICKEAFYGKELIIADRDMVETDSDEILRNADSEDVSFLVVGDPFG